MARSPYKRMIDKLMIQRGQILAEMEDDTRRAWATLNTARVTELDRAIVSIELLQAADMADQNLNSVEALLEQVKELQTAVVDLMGQESAGEEVVVEEEPDRVTFTLSDPHPDTQISYSRVISTLQLEQQKLHAVMHSANYDWRDHAKTLILLEELDEIVDIFQKMRTKDEQAAAAGYKPMTKDQFFAGFRPEQTEAATETEGVNTAASVGHDAKLYGEQMAEEGFYEKSPTAAEIANRLGLHQLVIKRRSDYRRNNVSPDTEKRRQLYHFALEDFFMDLEHDFVRLIVDAQINIDIPYTVEAASRALEDAIVSKPFKSVQHAGQDLRMAVKLALEEAEERRPYNP